MFRRQSPALPGLVFAASLAATGLLPALAQQPVAPAPVAQMAPDDGTDDPYENTNRAIFSFNQDVDKAVLVPVANAYRAFLPQPVQDSVHDFLQNLNSPIIFANDVLQARPDLAGETLGRFIINTTLGLGGLMDVATKGGIPYHTNDLGITFATWGVGPGPYLMLPVLGPSNPRDLTGDVADSFGDPGNVVASDYHYIWASLARSATAGIDERSRNIESLAEIERTSLDYYATVRSLARQRRAAQIRHQKEDVPNAAPLQGAGALPAPAQPSTTAELPNQSSAPITYSVVQHDPSMAPSPPPGR